MNRRHLLRHAVFSCAIELLPKLRGSTPRLATRIVPAELGTLFAEPNGFSYAQLGARVGMMHDTHEFAQMTPESIKIIQARFHVFKPSDETQWAYFPYSAFQRWDRQEQAAGRPALFITASYAGKRRPVLWKPSLALEGGLPTAARSDWKYAVNVGDERFVRFWVSQYVRGTLWRNLTNLSNLWVGLDECMFTLGQYGVLDDHQRFVGEVTWDHEFPQNETQYILSVRKFFMGLKKFDPEVRVATNVGSMQWDLFPMAFGSADGMMAEEIYFADAATSVARESIYHHYNAYAWASSQEKAMVLRSEVPPGDGDSIRSSLVSYLLLKGTNTSYAPRIPGTTLALPPVKYKDMQSTLGQPVGALNSTKEPVNAGEGYRLYWREFQSGIVYLNFTGHTKTIVLPNSRPWADATGVPVTAISVPDRKGTFVTSRTS